MGKGRSDCRRRPDRVNLGLNFFWKDASPPANWIIPSAVRQQLARWPIFGRARLGWQTLSYARDTRVLSFDGDEQQSFFASVGIAGHGPSFSLLAASLSQSRCALFTRDGRICGLAPAVTASKLCMKPFAGQRPGWERRAIRQKVRWISRFEPHGCCLTNPSGSGVSRIPISHYATLPHRSNDARTIRQRSERLCPRLLV